MAELKDIPDPVFVNHTLNHLSLKDLKNVAIVEKRMKPLVGQVIAERNKIKQQLYHFWKTQTLQIFKNKFIPHIMPQLREKGQGGVRRFYQAFQDQEVYRKALQNHLSKIPNSEIQRLKPYFDNVEDLHLIGSTLVSPEIWREIEILATVDLYTDSMSLEAMQKFLHASLHYNYS